MKLFKEWFKPNPSLEHATEKEKEEEVNRLRKEAESIEMRSPLKLNGKNENHLEMFNDDPQFRAWLVEQYPKNNDGNLADDYALHLVTHGYQPLENREKHYHEMDKSLDITYETVVRKQKEFLAQEQRMLDANHELFLFQKRQAMNQAPFHAKLKQAVGGNEFYNYEAEIAGVSPGDSERTESELTKRAIAEKEKCDLLEKQFYAANERWEAMIKKEGKFVNEKKHDEFELGN